MSFVLTSAFTCRAQPGARINSTERGRCVCVCVCVGGGGGGGGEGLKRGENIRSKHEVTPKHDLIGCQTWHDWLSII